MRRKGEEGTGWGEWGAGKCRGFHLFFFVLFCFVLFCFFVNAQLKVEI